MSEVDAHDEEHFRKFVPAVEGVLKRLEVEAVEKDVPIVGPVFGRLLSILARAVGAKNVLELGTATGYSAIWLAQAVSSQGGSITTVEWSGDMAERARRNIQEAGFSDHVTILQGDASSLLKVMDSQFDMAFIDIDKEHYSEAFELTLPLLRKGALIVFDNTSFVSGGDILERTFNHPDVDTVHFYTFIPEHSPEHDGITLCVKK